MAIGYPPQAVPQGNSDSTSFLSASTSQQVFPANPNRVSGYILNNANRVATVLFGTGAITAGAAIGTPVPAASGGQPGSIDLPDDYDGAIQIIWANGVNTAGNAAFHEIVP
jgi:hypothetical protein